MNATIRDLACQEIVEIVTDYLDGAMDPALRASFEEHLSGCPHCTHYLEQMRATIRLSGRLGTHDLSPQMRDDLVELYRRWRAEP